MLQKLIYELNRDPVLQELFAGNREDLLSRYRLNDEEADAIRRDDIGKLYILGVNGQILLQFAAWRGVRGECKTSPDECCR